MLFAAPVELAEDEEPEPELVGDVAVLLAPEDEGVTEAAGAAGRQPKPSQHAERTRREGRAGDALPLGLTVKVLELAKICAGFEPLTN